MSKPIADESAEPSPTTVSRMDRSNQLICAWGGPIAVLCALVGLVVIGGFIPAQAPSASAQTIVDFYSSHAARIRIGMILTMIGFTMFVPFGVAIAMQVRRIENRPTMTYVQIACVTIAALEGILSVMIWGTAAFRPGAINPDITLTLNDLGWFAFLWDIPPFTLWIGVIGYMILRDNRPAPIFPRWAGYLNLWVAMLIIPAEMIVFFKTGPFAFNGLLALYLPAGTFFLWMIIMTPLVISAIRREPRTATHDLTQQ